MTREREGQYKTLLEARISPKEYRQLEAISAHLNTTRAQLMRFMIETAVWKEYGE